MHMKNFSTTLSLLNLQNATWWRYCFLNGWDAGGRTDVFVSLNIYEHYFSPFLKPLL